MEDNSSEILPSVEDILCLRTLVENGLQWLAVFAK